jgi:hypothetical protein
MTELSLNKAEPMMIGSRSLLTTLLMCTLAVGVSDFLFASVSNGLMLQRTPVRVFQGVASVVFGRGALDGGLATAALGLLMHFCVAAFWSAVYLLVTRSSSAMRRLVQTPQGAVAFAAVYGPFIWIVMTFIVIPAFVHRPPTISPIWWVQLVGHSVFVVGPMIWAAGDGRSSSQLLRTAN